MSMTRVYCLIWFYNSVMMRRVSGQTSNAQEWGWDRQLEGGSATLCNSIEPSEAFYFALNYFVQTISTGDRDDVKSARIFLNGPKMTVCVIRLLSFIIIAVGDAHMFAFGWPPGVRTKSCFSSNCLSVALMSVRADYYAISTCLQVC